MNKHIMRFHHYQHAAFHAASTHPLEFTVTEDDRIAAGAQSHDIDDRMAAIADSGIRMLFAENDADYPSSLKAARICPPVLFVRSDTFTHHFFRDRAMIAVVGTRDPSDYGLKATRTVVEGIRKADGDAVIVSGLSIGVNTEAHTQAIKQGLSTIAVLPCGLDTVYPLCNFNLAQTIARAPGSALVSPFAPGTQPSAPLMLERNRVIAALCRQTVVVESRVRGGALVTARMAHSLGRSVLAVPGRIGDPRSEGCNNLIWSREAEIYHQSDMHITY